MRGRSAGFSRPLLLLAGSGFTTVETWDVQAFHYLPGKSLASGPRGKRLTKWPGQETLVADVLGGEWQLVPGLKVQFQRAQWKERWEVRSESF